MGGSSQAALFEAAPVGRRYIHCPCIPATHSSLHTLHHTTSSTHTQHEHTSCKDTRGWPTLRALPAYVLGGPDGSSPCKMQETMTSARQCMDGWMNGCNEVGSYGWMLTRQASYHLVKEGGHARD